MRLEMFKEAKNVLYTEKDHNTVEEITSDMQVEIALETKEMEMQRRKYQLFSEVYSFQKIKQPPLLEWDCIKSSKRWRREVKTSLGKN